MDWSPVERVVLIRLRSIGDTVLMTPCLTALKAWRSNVEISVICEPLAAPLLEGHPLVDKLIVAGTSTASRLATIARLRKSRFDIAFNMHGGSTGSILARLSGARYSIGYAGLPLARMLTHRAPSPDVILGRAHIHSVEQQLALLKWSGMPWPKAPRLRLVVSLEIMAKIRERLAAQPGMKWKEAYPSGYACVAPGAALESKRWSAEGFAAVADHLKQRWNLSTVVIAGPGQERLANEVAFAARHKAAVLSGLSLKELIALLQLACVFVGNDSGPMHIASALDRPVVAVWGSSNPTVWHPWTEAPWRIVGGEAWNREAASGRGGNPAIREIPPAEVIAAVDEVLEPALEANHKAGWRAVYTERA